MIEIVRKIGRCRENNEKLKNYKIPISHVSALETLLKNSNSHFDNVCRARMKTITENQNYLSKNELTLKYFDVSQYTFL